MIGPVSGTGRAMMASLQQAMSKGMPPDQAIQYVKGMATQGVAPLADLYAMMNQFQRLKQQPAQAPQTPPTIRDQLNMAEQQQAMMQQGVASLPAPVMEQAQFAGGGIVAFSDGGLNATDELFDWDNWNRQFQEANPQQRARLLEWADKNMPTFSKWGRALMARSGDGVVGKYATKAAKLGAVAGAGLGAFEAAGSDPESVQETSRLAQLGMDVNPQSKFKTGLATFTGTLESALPTSFLYTTPLEKAVERTGERIAQLQDPSSGVQLNLSPTQKKLAEQIKNLVKQTGSWESPEVQELVARYRLFQRQETPTTPSSNNQAAPAAPAGLPATPPRRPAGPAARSGQAVAPAARPGQAVAPAAPEDLSPEALIKRAGPAAEALAKWREAQGIGQADEQMRSFLSEENERLTKQFGQDKMLAFAEAGFKMAAAASRPGATFLGALSEGAISGTQALRGLNKEMDANRRAMREAMIKLRQAEEARKEGDFKTAMQIDQQYRTELFERKKHADMMDMDARRLAVMVRGQDLDLEGRKIAAAASSARGAGSGSSSGTLGLLRMKVAGLDMDYKDQQDIANDVARSSTERAQARAKMGMIRMQRDEMVSGGTLSGASGGMENPYSGFSATLVEE